MKQPCKFLITFLIAKHIPAECVLDHLPAAAVDVYLGALPKAEIDPLTEISSVEPCRLLESHPYWMVFRPSSMSPLADSAGRQNQYVYMPTNDDSKATAQNGAIKVDVSSSKQQVVGRISFGDRCFGGELVFVPRHQDLSGLKGDQSLTLAQLENRKCRGKQKPHCCSRTPGAFHALVMFWHAHRSHAGGNPNSYSK